MGVCRCGFAQTTTSHHDEAGAIHKRILVIEMLAEKVLCLGHERQIDMHDGE